MTKSARDDQVGGSHYRDMRIQPSEYIHANAIGYHEGSAISYLSRWKSKGGREDLRKAIHMIELLLEHEEATSSVPDSGGETAKTDAFSMPVTLPNSVPGSETVPLWSKRRAHRDFRGDTPATKVADDPVRSTPLRDVRQNPTLRPRFVEE